jgi:hypothetical protein
MIFLMYCICAVLITQYWFWFDSGVPDAFYARNDFGWFLFAVFMSIMASIMGLFGAPLLVIYYPWRYLRNKI